MVWINNGTPGLDAQSQYQTILAVCIVLPIVTTTIVCLRGYTRARILHVLGIDDYIIFFGCLCAIVYSGLCIGQSKWGLGLPIKLRPKQNLNEYSVINFAGRPFYQIGILTFKVALCFAYLRIMKASTHKMYKTVTWIIMITCILGHIAATFILIFQCSPVRKSWLPLTPGTCLPNDSTFYGLAAISIVFDIIIFCLPIPLLLSLNVHMKKKIALVCIFLLGLLTTVCSVMRMVQIIAIAKSGNSTMLVLWGVVELNVGIILTCLPTLGPLIPYFHTSTHDAPSKSAYALSSVTRNHNLASQNASHQTGVGPMGFDKYGDRAATNYNANGLHIDGDSTGSQDDMVRLKGHADPLDMSNHDGDIVRTTDIRVSVDDPEGAEHLGTNTTGRAW